MGDVHGKGKGAIAGSPKFSKEKIGLSKAEAKAEPRQLVEEFSGSLFANDKPYPGWMEWVPSRWDLKDPMFLSLREWASKTTSLDFHNTDKRIVGK